MPKFKKKPLEVDAEQWFPGKDVVGVWEGDPHERAYVITIHGERANLAPGDWVITEPDGAHHYPCKPDIFDATYNFVG